MRVSPVATPTKAEAAFIALRDAIRYGRLRPGQRLTLQQLAKDLGMSLTPVREALHRLAAQGLVQHRPNIGTVVTEYTQERAEEVYRLRLVLEPMAVKLAAEAIDEAGLEVVEAALGALEEAIAAGRDVDVPPLNERLHQAIYQAARSPFLLEFIDRLWTGVPFQSLTLASRKRKSAEQHDAIVDAIRRQDGAEAARRMYEHIADARAEALELLDNAADSASRADSD